MKGVVRVVAATAVVLLALSCAPKRPQPATPPVAARPAGPAAVATARYVELAASAALFSVRSSELLLDRGASARLRAVAETIASEQRGIGAQLSFAGRRLNLLPSARLLPEHQAQLDALAADADVETRYRQQQRSEIGRALALHRSYAARGDSPTMRPVARVGEESCARHLALLGGL